MISGFEGLAPHYGDLHNHCGLAYCGGSPAEALANARLQLDFVSLTVHGAWPDVPERAFATTFRFRHRFGHERLDACRVRVRQRNDQWAWSSPVWMERPGDDGSRRA